MKLAEFQISGYPLTWDSLNVRDLLINHGSILRIRSHPRGFSFVTFHLPHSSDQLSSAISKGNTKLTIKPPQSLENYKFEEIPPHCTAYNIRSGFIRWQSDCPFFIEKDTFYAPSLMLAKDNTIELHLWKSSQKFKLIFKFRSIAYTSCIDRNEDLEVFIQLNQPPEIYKSEKRKKFFPIWTIGINEPGWKRTTSIFEDFDDLLRFEIKKLALVFRVNKKFDAGMIECLRSIQAFEDFVELSDLGLPLGSEDIETSGLCFQVKFMLYSLLSLTIISAYDLTVELLQELVKLDSGRLVFAIENIISAHRSLALRTLPDFYRLVLDYYNDDTIFNPGLLDGYEQINRVLITPTTTYFRVGEPELSNRVTRQYCEYKEDFLRVTFTDENLNKILPYPEDLLQRVETCLENFLVAGKNFRVLAYSASQLKQHSVWMLALESPIKHEQIYSWLGDFSNIKVKGKYVARIGLSFSSSKKIIDLKPDEIEIIHDIACNGYVFSDGVGTISQELTNDINQIAKSESCAFQFRMGGTKGVVSLDDRLTGRKLCIRSSMIKYECPLTTFELLNPSEYRFGFLNRQLIMLLNTLGTPADVFLTLHKEMLQSINEDCLAFFLCMRSMNPTNLAMQCLNKLMSRPKEPLAAEIKSLLLKRTLQQLRKKQKIFLAKSGCLIGVIDEKGILQYGECFVQVPQGVIVSDVIVAKNPCLHPGDIRLLKAVDRKELHHLRNVLVFPNNGPRPHTNECSGSDLDGDLYFVTWETRLIPPVDHPPMIYDSTPPIETNDPISAKTLIEFFQTFVTNDKLGQIDNLHLAIADASEYYAHDEQCIRLSELHSIAVDFAKTGNIVIIPKEYLSVPFPDFMEHHSPQSYKSSKILGILYREVKEIPEISIPEATIENLVTGYEKFLSEARKLVSDYKKDLEMLMKRFGVGCEVELIIAQPLELTNYFQKKKREDEIRELLNLNSNKLIEKHRKAFEEVASRELASACYWISHDELDVRAYPWVIIPFEYLIGEPEVN